MTLGIGGPYAQHGDARGHNPERGSINGVTPKRRVAAVGDRGMLTRTRIREEVKPAGLDWISRRRNSAQDLCAEYAPLPMSLFDERDLAEISATNLYPSERLIVCRTLALAAERDRKRQALLASMQTSLHTDEPPHRRAFRPSPPRSALCAIP